MKQKIGRNQPCHCGSGQKYKKCHGRLANAAPPAPGPRSLPWHAVPPEVRQQFEEHQRKQKAFENAHGKGKPIISMEHGELRFVAVGNELHYSKANKTKFFPDFLSKYLLGLLDEKWRVKEIGKAPADWHPILQWYERMCRYQGTLKPDADGFYRQEGTGAMMCWYRLAYDLYLIKHNAKLQRKILNRLLHKDQFQGARFELLVTASMAVAGFQIDYEDETDTSKTHTEFLARHPSGAHVFIEAKSRHRDGVLGFKSAGAKVSDKIEAEAILRAALGKVPPGPYLIFIDVNLPPSAEKPSTEHPWYIEMAGTATRLVNEWEPSTFPANAILFCNDPSHYSMDTPVEGIPFWCFEVPVPNARHRLDERIGMAVARAAIQRSNIPNEFPD